MKQTRFEQRRTKNPAHDHFIYCLSSLLVWSFNLKALNVQEAGYQLRHTGILSDRRPNRPSYKDPNLHRIILCLQIDRREYLKGHWIYIIQIGSLLLVEG